MDCELLLGDARALLPTMESGSVDFVFADPPYFLSNDGFTVNSGKAVSVNKGDWDKSMGFAQDVAFHRTWISECLRLLTKDGTIAISGTYHSIYQCGFILQELGCRILNDIIWFKPNGSPALGRRNFTASHETILWASKGTSAHHTFHYQESKDWPTGTDSLKRAGKQMRSVWRIPTTPSREKLRGKHPTQKPLGLMHRLIALCTDPNDRILDPFCGSGTTAVAALGLGRRFIGIDVDQACLDLTRSRLGDL